MGALGLDVGVALASLLPVLGRSNIDVLHTIL